MHQTQQQDDGGAGSDQYRGIGIQFTALLQSSIFFNPVSGD
jgi:hypothetical protein